MKGYKGFKKGMICLDKQYAENTVYEEDRAELCTGGMHFCENPMDVLNFYPLINEDGTENEFAEVEALAPVESDGNKSVTTKLKIGSKLSLKDFIKASINFTFSKAGKAFDSCYAQLESNDSFTQLATCSFVTQSASCRDDARLLSSSASSALASSGVSSKLVSSSVNSRLASSGIGSVLASCGDKSRLASSGNHAHLVSTGNRSLLASSGSSSQLASSGDRSVVCNIGMFGWAKATVGSWITLAEYDDDGNVLCVKTEYVDGERIKGNTWYRLKDGEFCERD